MHPLGILALVLAAALGLFYLCKLEIANRRKLMHACQEVLSELDESGCVLSLQEAKRQRPNEVLIISDIYCVLLDSALKEHLVSLYQGASFLELGQRGIFYLDSCTYELKLSEVSRVLECPIAYYHVDI